MTPPHVVLVGAGHANLLVVRAARRLTRRRIGVTLIDPDAFWYSGMAAAAAGGVVHPGRDRVDPRPLAASRGVRVVTGRAVALHTDARVLELDDGTALPATAVVVNVGSDVDPRGLPVDLPGVVPVKPTRGLLTLRDELVAGPPGARVVVVGAGASAVEVAANLAAGPVAEVASPSVTVVADGALVPVVDDEVRSLIRSRLRARAVRIVTGRATDIRPGAGSPLDVEVAGDHPVPADHVVLATGLRAAAAVTGLALGDAEGMPTTATLQHPDHPWVLGAGDAISFARAGLPRLGVFAVRQAPVIVDNLLALHGHGRLREYEPQSQWVTALDLGDGEALVMRGSRWFAGRGGLVVKRLLDEWFLRRHRLPIGASGRSWGRSVQEVASGAR